MDVGAALGDQLGDHGSRAAPISSMGGLGGRSTPLNSLGKSLRGELSPFACHVGGRGFESRPPRQISL
jgi:hypothetical protein